MNADVKMWVLMHQEGCGKPAYLRAKKPLPTDPVNAELCYHLDGSAVVESDPLVCESCGERLRGVDVVPRYWEPYEPLNAADI